MISLSAVRIVARFWRSRANGWSTSFWLCCRTDGPRCAESHDHPSLLALRAVPAAAFPAAGPALTPLEGMTVAMVTVVCCVVEGSRVGARTGLMLARLLTGCLVPFESQPSHYLCPQEFYEAEPGGPACQIAGNRWCADSSSRCHELGCHGQVARRTAFWLPAPSLKLYKKLFETGLLSCTRTLAQR